MAKYIYNVMYTVSVEADNEEDAYVRLLEDDPEFVNTDDSDIQFCGVEEDEQE